MANETLGYCDMGPGLLGEETYKRLNAQQGGVGGASDLGPAFLSPPEPEAVVEPEAEQEEAPAPKPAAKKRAR